MAADIETKTEAPLSHEQRAWQWRILISTYLAYGGYYLCRKTFSICKKDLASEFQVSIEDIAYIWAAYLVAYMLGQFISSYLGRKKGPRFLLLGGLCMTIACNLVFGFANSYNTFFVFMIFNGLFQASGWPGCVGGVAEWLRKKERGTIMGVWSTNYTLFSLVVKWLGGYLLGAYGWRYAYFGCTLAAVAIWWLIYFWQRNRPQDVGLEAIVETEVEEGTAPVSEHITFAEYLRVLFNPVVLLMGCGFFCVKTLRYALDSWLPFFLQVQGLANDAAAYYSSVFEFAGLAGVLVAGFLFDRYFRKNWALLCLLMSIGMVLGYLCVVRFGADPLLLALSFGLVGFMLCGPDTLLCGAVAVQAAGECNAVAVAGIVNGIGSIGPIVQELVIGHMLNTKDPLQGMRNANYLTLAMSVAFALVMLLALWRTRTSRKRENG